ncbi:CPBP family intramembrane glutamic endopeptidase [Fodinicola acaciae]|uniref:CPBP family intramembrane glutamic endopeptidase n=1 Tax=Fodinicola acaciae TaxID=2681555 RepID=UPI0013D7CDC6|nr:type II CAAX endopeptidase family protein [Fodinicola acaciae]
MHAASHDQTATPSAEPAAPRPGWTELIVGIVALLVLEVGCYRLFLATKPSPVALAVFMTSLSAIVAGGGFGAAALVRIRSWSAFGVRRTTWRWLLIGLAGAVVATLLKIPAVAGYTALTGDHVAAQESWSAVNGGVWTLIAGFLFLGIATPICEELLFRGVVATALLRYGAIIGVVGSSVIFAVLHGFSSLLPIAFIVGLLTAELRRRSDSIWPGVILHCGFNLFSSVGLFLLT